MSNKNDTTTPEDAGCGVDSDAESSRAHVSRASKACENCRIRRIKCEPPYPCKACRLAKLTGCHVRPKARPGRQSRQQDPTKILNGTGYRERISGLERLDRELEAIFEEKTGGPIDLKVVEEHTHPLLDLSSPLPPLPSLDPSASAAIRQFTIYCLPYCSFLTPTRISHLFDRYEASPLSLSPDQRALVYVCLACGYIRLQYFGEGGRRARFVSEKERLDVVWYRQAVDALDKWGSATFTSLHALFCMWFYTTLVCKSDATRLVCSWMISQARELGLHQEQTALAVPYSPSDRADLMFVMILYAHYYSVALCGHPPMIKPGEFDTVIFHSSDLHVDDQSSAIVPRRAVVELLLLNTQSHLNLHDEAASNLSIDWLLRIEHNWTAWRRSWIKHGRPVWDPYTGILWDWGRIVVRAAILHDDRFSMSSLAILARSSSQILARYYDFYLTEPYNLVWQHLRQIITCSHVVLLCFSRFELIKREAEQSISISTWLLDLSEPRWLSQARYSKDKMETIAKAFGLELTPILTANDSDRVSPDMSWLSNTYLSDMAQPGFLFTNDASNNSSNDKDVTSPSSFDYFFGLNPAS